MVFRKTPEEWSLVCRPADVPADALRCENGWRAMKVVGELDFSLIGILSSLSQVLAEAKICLFALSTYRTDYLLVKETDLEAAVRALEQAGHTIKQGKEGEA